MIKYKNEEYSIPMGIKYHDLSGYVLSSSWTGILTQAEKDNQLIDRMTKSVEEFNALAEYSVDNNVFHVERTRKQ